MSVVPNYAPFRQKSLGDCTRPLLNQYGFSVTYPVVVPNRAPFVKRHPGIAPDLSFQLIIIRCWNAGLTKNGHVPKGTRGHQASRRVR